MNKVKLSDIAHITMGQSPEGSTCNETGEGTPLLNGPTEFTDFYPTPKQYTSDPKRMSEAGDILFCVRGSTTGRMNWSDQPYAIGRGLASLSHKKGKNLNHFLKYLIEYNLDSLLHTTGGSTFPNLTSDMLASYELFVPDLPVQEKISHLLSALDKKIELNQRINAQLDSITKMLYEYWFIQFDFPNEIGKPYKSSGGKMFWSKGLNREIPKDWEAKPLSELTPVSNESINPFEDPEHEFKHYSIPSFDEIGTYSVELGKEIKSNKFVVCVSDILVSKLNPWFNRVIYTVEERNLICSTEFVVWRTLSNSLKNYLFMIAQDSVFVSYCTQSATGTSHSHRRINPSVMMKYEVPYSSKIVELFGKKIDPLLKGISMNQIENRHLSELRNWLLPMLMNGQATINENWAQNDLLPSQDNITSSLS